MGGIARSLQELSTSSVAALPAGAYLIAWPVASLEQHGPQLPLGTDALVLQSIVENVREQLGADFPVLFLPQQSIGKSPEHLAFPGTTSFQASTMLNICDDLVSSLSAHGFKQFVFINGHGGNSALLQSYGYDLRHKYQVRIYNIDLWGSSFFDEIIAQVFPDLVGTEVHAGSVEVSLMMYLYPKLVGAQPRVHPPKSFGEPVHYCWSSEEFDPSGVIGDPTQASSEKGEIIFRYAVEKTCRYLRAIIRDLKI